MPPPLQPDPRSLSQLSPDGRPLHSCSPTRPSTWSKRSSSAPSSATIGGVSCHFAMADPLGVIIFFTVSTLLILSPFTNANYDITGYGAKAGNGSGDCSQALAKAWRDACSGTRSAMIYVPKGEFVLHPVLLSGPCRSPEITVKIDGTFVASPNYWIYGSVRHWLSFQYVKGVRIVGGNLDGRGHSLWACKSASRNCPEGAPTLIFTNARDIVVTGLTSIDSELYHLVFNGCRNVNVHGVTILAAGTSPNTDGIHVQLSSAVTITNTSIQTGDDCISVGPGTEHLWIEHVSCGPGHGISIGSLGRDARESGVRNITVKNSQISGTQNGLRIKSWARMSTGFVRGVIFEKVTMKDVNNPIVIDQFYCPGNKNCPRQNSGVRISQVRYEDIKGSSATPIAVKFACSPDAPCQGISLVDVDLKFQKLPAQSSCKNAAGTASGVMVPPSCL